MEYTKEVIGVFPTPIARISITDDFASEIALLKNTDMRKTDGGYYVHLQSDNTYILELADLVNLKNKLEIEVSKYMQEILSFTQGGTITQSWVNMNSPGEGTHLHAHPNSIVSGVYYMDIPETSGVIRFHRTKQNISYYMEPTVDPTHASGNFWAYDFIDITVKTGDLLLFPSWVQHSVPINPTKEIRWSLAINSMPIYGLGERRNLSELVTKPNSELDLLR
jgi:uncharacterized protein (TIGR02466 family)